MSIANCSPEQAQDLGARRLPLELNSADRALRISVAEVSPGLVVAIHGAPGLLRNGALIGTVHLAGAPELHQLGDQVELESPDANLLLSNDECELLRSWLIGATGKAPQVQPL